MNGDEGMKKERILAFIGGILLLLSELVFAATTQSISSLLESAENFAYQGTRDLPGSVKITLNKMDSNIALPKCSRLESFLPTGSRLWGKTSIGVRCNDQQAWTIYIQVDIEVITKVIHSAKPILRDHTINEGDIVFKEVNLVRMSEGAFTDSEKVIGKVAVTNINVGQPIYSQSVRAPHIIQRGQKVKLIVEGSGFSVSTEVEALSAAAEGQVLQIRNQKGRIMTGVARQDGAVEIKRK